MMTFVFCMTENRSLIIDGGPIRCHALFLIIFALFLIIFALFLIIFDAQSILQLSMITYLHQYRSVSNGYTNLYRTMLQKHSGTGPRAIYVSRSVLAPHLSRSNSSCCSTCKFIGSICKMIGSSCKMIDSSCWKSWLKRQGWRWRGTAHNRQQQPHWVQCWWRHYSFAQIPWCPWPWGLGRRRGWRTWGKIRMYHSRLTWWSRTRERMWSKLRFHPSEVMHMW